MFGNSNQNVVVINEMSKLAKITKDYLNHNESYAKFNHFYRFVIIAHL